MSLRTIAVGSSLLVATLVVACSSAEPRSAFVLDKSPTDPAKSGVKTTPSFTGSDTGSDPTNSGVAAQDCDVNNRGDGDPNKDYDGDGFTLANDCNECNKAVNAGARDVPGNGIDEDCSGKADDEAVSCDDGLADDPGDGFVAAAALGLCKKADSSGVGWGVVSAKFVKPDGKTLSDDRGYGTTEKFGNNTPHEGKRFFVLSTGQAREKPTSGHDQDHVAAACGMPSGYPKDSTNCPNTTPSPDAFDGSGLQVKIRVPSNAKSFSYDQFFLTQEFPTYVCSSFNDFFVAMMSPVPQGLADGNIAFDAKGNALGVNNDMFRVCKAGDYTIGADGLGGLGGIFGGGGASNSGTRHFDCPDGQDGLKNTGFEGNGGTGWLTTSAPVTPGEEITLLFAVWDAGDGAYDSTVLLDNFQWSFTDSGTATTAPTDVK